MLAKSIRSAWSLPAAACVALVLGVSSLATVPNSARAEYEQEAFDESYGALMQSYVAWEADGGGYTYNYYVYLYAYYGYYYAAVGYYDDNFRAFDSAVVYHQYAGQLADSMLIYLGAGAETYAARSEIIEAGTYCYAAFNYGLYEDDVAAALNP